MSTASLFQNPSSGRESKSGFTLIELMMVMSIMVILMVLIAPAISSLLDTKNLTQGAQSLVDQINLARQMASSRNASVEVRLIKLTSISAKGYSAVQIWANDASGHNAVGSNVIILPQGIVISEDAKASMALALLVTGTMPAGAGRTANAPYKSFKIGPAGMVNPVIAMKDFCWAVVPVRFADGDTPKNYVTIQLNPLIATPLVYRP